VGQRAHARWHEGQSRSPARRGASRAPPQSHYGFLAVETARPRAAKLSRGLGGGYSRRAA
jgi:hypothetical protein